MKNRRKLTATAGGDKGRPSQRGSPTIAPPSNKANQQVQGEVDASHWITVNVGGELFQTTIATLTYEPSILRRWAHEAFAGCERDEDGHPFIDRDPATFRHVLNFLRGYPLDLNPEESLLVAEDAEWYGMAALQQEVGSRFEGRFVPGPGVSRDGRTFSTALLVAHIGPFLSAGSHSVTLLVEKLSDCVGFAVVNEKGSTNSEELVGRSGTVCLLHSGELIATMSDETRVDRVQSPRLKDGDTVVMSMTFRGEVEGVEVQFGRGVAGPPDHTITVPHQPLRFAVWTHRASSVQLVSSRSTGFTPEAMSGE